MNAPPPLRSARGLSTLTSVLSLAIVVALAGFMGFLSAPAPSAAASSALIGGSAFPPCVIQDGGYLTGAVSGALTVGVDWHGSDLACEGGERPDGAGLRLFFAARSGANPQHLALVVGLDTTVQGLVQGEYPANVTLIDEEGSQFYNSGRDRCFTRIDTVSTSAADPEVTRVKGALYCSGAIAAVVGNGFVNLSDMAFAGRLRTTGF